MNVTAFYRTVYDRTNKLKKLFYGFFLQLSSITLIPIEVFWRKNMGQRYFSMFHTVMACLILSIVPLLNSGIGYWITGLFSRYGGYGHFGFHLDFGQRIYLGFLVLVIIGARKRASEIKKELAVFDLQKFSLYSGDIHPLIRNFGGKYRDIRTIETKIEPFISFMFGLIISLISHPLGYMLMIFSFINMVGQRAAYYFGDQYMLDQIDKMILNHELKETFIGDKEESNGVRTPFVRPRDPEVRKRILEEDEIEEREFVS
jgi:hypothetical protein